MRPTWCLEEFQCGAHTNKVHANGATLGILEQHLLGKLIKTGATADVRSSVVHCMVGQHTGIQQGQIGDARRGTWAPRLWNF